MKPQYEAPLQRAKATLSQLTAHSDLQAVHLALGRESALHFVGGVVRDTLSSEFFAATRTTSDLDLATRLHPEVVKTKLASVGIRTIDTGLQHGTLTVLTNELKFELTTFRQPGPRLENSYSEEIETDLSGRDFTINAIAFAFDGLTLVDPSSGIEDLLSSTLRAVGDPSERLREDPLRVVRVARFGPAAKRTIDEKLLRAARTASSSLAGVAQERLRDELSKILLALAPQAGIRALYDLGALKFILPEALPAVDFEQNEYHNENVFEHTLSVLDGTPDDLVVRLAALLHDLGKPHTLSVDESGRRHFYLHETVSAEIAVASLERLRFEKDTISEVTKIVRLHMRPIECGASGARRLLRDLGDSFDRWLLLKRADKTPTMDLDDFQKRMSAFLELVHQERTRQIGSVYSKLALNGEDILSLGVRAGPQVGRILKALWEQVLDQPELNTHDQLKTIARKLAQEL